MVIETRVAEILLSAGQQSSPLRPTELYNEGWMLRLLLDWSARYAIPSHPFFFLPGARWCSEALLHSQFLPRFRGDPLSESWTHADGVIGHFAIGSSGRGDLALDPEALQLVVVEAKLYSPLSARTKNAGAFDQAARSVACLAELLRRAQRQPQTLNQLAFYLVAPQAQIESGLFGSFLTPESLRAKVQERIRPYEGDKDRWYSEWFEPTLKTARVQSLAWEALLPADEPQYQAFYQKCLEFNGPLLAGAPKKA
jgi:hypothetical protein